MVGKAQSVSSGGQGYDYALGKDNAEVLEKKGVIAENGKELKEEFKMYQEKNSRCENNNINIIISPSQEDKLSNDDLRGIANDMMKKMELDKHQYVVVKHTPPDNRVHLHIYCNRIDANGKAYKDGRIGIKVQKKAQEIAQERGLTNVKDIAIQKDILLKENLKEIRQQIYDKHNEVMKLDKPKTFENYSELMKGKGVEINPTKTKQGKIQGFRVKYQNFDLKATQVHRNMSLSRTGLKTDLPLTKSLATPKTKILDDVGVKLTNIGMNIGKKIIKKAIDKGIGM